MQKPKPKKLTTAQELKKLQAKVNRQEKTIKELGSLLKEFVSYKDVINRDIANILIKFVEFQKDNSKFNKETIERIWELIRGLSKIDKSLSDDIEDIYKRINVQKESKAKNLIINVITILSAIASKISTTK